MRVLYFATKADAWAFCTRIDTAMRLPACHCRGCDLSLCGCVRCTGDGPLECARAGKTLRWAEPYERADATQWAVQVSDEIFAHLTAGERAAITTLDASWLPTSPTDTKRLVTATRLAAAEDAVAVDAADTKR